ncbi:uncharacterized protein LOC121990711 [Zingiber officinale]|uniref:Uncharacterized protein n=1 Tax=Zingiber officinale TaxID=94328 RepID=A0A8J5G027_ZINOF|nr:uncharacterized protein LOC121990711 [Zingiber officinale]KAG6498438.1 hypothetical protein ZIOFF_046351 [Zingiber officinale]
MDLDRDRRLVVLALVKAGRAYLDAASAAYQVERLGFGHLVGDPAADAILSFKAAAALAFKAAAASSTVLNGAAYPAAAVPVAAPVPVADLPVPIADPVADLAPVPIADPVADLIPVPIADPVIVPRRPRRQPSRRCRRR